jgi:hypothetical protein
MDVKFAGVRLSEGAKIGLLVAPRGLDPHVAFGAGMAVIRGYVRIFAMQLDSLRPVQGKV